MKQRLITIFLLCLVSTLANAGQRNIIALVNNEPITSYQFLVRKKMVMALNNIDNPDKETDQKLSNAVLNNLIEEELLFQHAEKVGSKVVEQEIDDAIATIAERNKMPVTSLLQYLSDKKIDIPSFRTQVKSELIKINILSYISRSVTVTPAEIDYTILSNNKKNIRVSANIFTSKGKTDEMLNKMSNLQKKLVNCNNIQESAYKNFATVQLIDKNLGELDGQLQTIMGDLRVHQKSSIFEGEKGFQLILLCNKSIEGITENESQYVTNFITNKKMSQKAQKFFEDLRKKAYVKIL